MSNTAPTINWPGKSGTQYTYGIYPISVTFVSVPGNYVFAQETAPNQFKPIYIGETGDLSERFDNHHKMPSIQRHRATHICVHQSPGDANLRRAEERDLIARWNPPCNG